MYGQPIKTELRHNIVWLTLIRKVQIGLKTNFSRVFADF